MVKLWKDWSRVEFLNLPYLPSIETRFRELYFFTPGTKHDSGYGNIALFSSRIGSIPEFSLGTCDDLRLDLGTPSTPLSICTDDIRIDANNRGIFRVWLRPNKEFVLNGVGSSRWLYIKETSNDKS